MRHIRWQATVVAIATTVSTALAASPAGASAAAASPVASSVDANRGGAGQSAHPKFGPVLREGTPESVGLDPAPIAAAIDKVRALEQAPPDGNPAYAGAVAVYGHQGTIVASDASGFALKYADATTELPAAQQIPMREDTLFDIASISKLFTSILAVQLIEQGRLDLQAPVAQYLPEFAAAGKQAVTIEQLLTHTSGFVSWIPLYSAYPDKQSRLQAVLNQPLSNPPGTTYLYSDLNMISLAMVIERVTGTRLEVLVRTKITVPLQMRDTMYNPSRRLQPRTAATEFQVVPDRGMVWGEVHDENAWSLGGIAGHAGVFSTGRDLAVLSQALLNGGAYGHRRILQPASVELLRTDFNTEFPGHAHGLGFEINQAVYMGKLAGPNTVGHTGYTGTSLVIDFSTGSFAILLTNRVHPSRNWSGVNLGRVAWADGLYQALAAATSG